MKLATWNVNSVRARLAHVCDWLAEKQPDLLALQETKTVDADFPVEAFRALGYHVACSGQKSYNGVAVLSRAPTEVLFTALDDEEDPQRRVLAVRAAGVTLLDLYVPNGASVGSDKYVYKLRWLERLHRRVAGLLTPDAPLAVVGDFNIAPADIDVHDPAAWAGNVLVSEPERERLRSLLGLGLQDAFRLLDDKDGGYTWWDYRAGGFRRNLGLRIDLILVSPVLAARLRACAVDREPRGREQPSDHAPVLAEFDWPPG